MKKLLLGSVALAALTLPALADSDLPTCDGITTGSCAVKAPFANTNVGGTRVPRTIHVDVTNVPTGTIANPVVATVPGKTAGTAPTTFSPTGQLVGGAAGGLDQPVRGCDQYSFYTGADNGSKTLVPGVVGRKTYFCGLIFTTGATATTLTLYKGTNADCAASAGAIGPPIALLANSTYGWKADKWTGLVTATNGDFVCVNASAGNQHTAEAWVSVQ